MVPAPVTLQGSCHPHSSCLRGSASGSATTQHSCSRNQQGLKRQRSSWCPRPPRVSPSRGSHPPCWWRNRPSQKYLLHRSPAPGTVPQTTFDHQFLALVRLSNLYYHKQNIRTPHHGRDILHHIRRILCMLPHL